MTPKQDWIQSQLPNYPNQSAAEICSQLNTKRLINNPIPITEVPKPVSVDDVSALLDPATRFKVQQTETWKFILSDYSLGISKYFIPNLENLLGGGIISQQQHDTILALLQQTIPDPNYQSQINISPAEEAGFGLVYTDEILNLPMQ
jgi:hypothetical protein